MKMGESATPVGIPLRILILDDGRPDSGHLKTLEDYVKSTFGSVSARTGTKIDMQEPELTENPDSIYRIIENDENLPDLIFCDLNLKKNGSGEEVARRIAGQHYPTDVLLYSYGKSIDKDINIISRYGVVLAANESKIEGYTESLVWRTIIKLSDPEYIRGLILSRATDTESHIDDCLVALFRIEPALKKNFKLGVLRIEGNGPGMKYRVFNSTLEDAIMEEIHKEDSKAEKSPEAIEKFFKGMNKDIPSIYSDKSFGDFLRHLEGILTDIFKQRNQVAHGVATSDSKGGLIITNKLQFGNNAKKGKNPASENEQYLSRDELKKFIYNCYKADQGLSWLLEFTEKLRNRS